MHTYIILYLIIEYKLIKSASRFQKKSTDQVKKLAQPIFLISARITTCTNCQVKKAKCSGKAICANCKWHNRECIYVKLNKKRGPKSKLIAPKLVNLLNKKQRKTFSSSFLLQFQSPVIFSFKNTTKKKKNKLVKFIKVKNNKKPFTQLFLISISKSSCIFCSETL